MLVISGTPEGTTPGLYAKGKHKKALKLSLDKIRASFQKSLKGKGPFRKVPRTKVRIGDIAIFKAGKRRVDRKAEIDIKKGEIIHSAMVIRVTGKEIELLEKSAPWAPMMTRTVSEVMKKYAKDRPIVQFLTPALKGMPGKSRRRLGLKPPTEKFTVAKGKAPEHTHILFKVNTHVTLPHEDKKLFTLIAQHKNKVAIKIHGYASLEGSEKYNLNLSAHRAVVVKKVLLKHLPPGSKAEAIAHGETLAFGSRRQNRRAGIEL